MSWKPGREDLRIAVNQSTARNVELRDAEVPGGTPTIEQRKKHQTRLGRKPCKVQEVRVLAWMSTSSMSELGRTVVRYYSHEHDDSQSRDEDNGVMDRQC